MSLLDWRHVPLMFVDDLDQPELDPADHHHFARVRRVSDGDSIIISDGCGRWRPARFGLRPTADGELCEEPPPKHPLTVGFTPVKAERPEWVVQKLTELGVDVIVPLQADRSVVRWDAEKFEKNRSKWSVIVREAAMQSRRVRLPHIEDLTPVSAVPTDVGTVLADPAGRPLQTTDHTVLIGPEGGWSEAERSAREVRSLPGGILRAETAALVAAALLADQRSRL